MLIRPSLTLHVREDNIDFALHPYNRGHAMALVRTIDHRDKDIRAVHNITTCTYTVFVDESGRRYLQLETYGSIDREIPGKVKQTLQFDRGSAGKLIEVLRETFSDLK